LEGAHGKKTAGFFLGGLDTATFFITSRITFPFMYSSFFPVFLVFFSFHFLSRKWGRDKDELWWKDSGRVNARKELFTVSLTGGSDRCCCREAGRGETIMAERRELWGTKREDWRSVISPSCTLALEEEGIWRSPGLERELAMGGSSLGGNFLGRELIIGPWNSLG
jgi:hypothetical protein